jgi:ABC-type uncharacterized transport system involved in gliding motility auxiliary subunit
MVNRVLSFLSWVGIALLLAAVALRLGPSFGLANVIKPEWDKYATFLFWGGVVLVVAYTAGQWREIATYFSRRNARYGALAGISVVVGLGILAAVNYLAARENKRWDLTESKQYTLSDQSVKLVKELDSPVKFVVFDRPTNFDAYRSRLNGYAYYSKNVSVDFVDPAKDMIQARQYGIQKYGTVAIAYKDRIERATSDSEQDITNALIKVINPQKRKLYFLLGHDEKDPSSSDERVSYSGIGEALKAENIEFASLVLAQTKEVPADATEIVIAGPKVDLLDEETTLIRGYLTKGGKLLVLLDPPDDVKKPAPMPNLVGLLKDYGITATSSIIVDGSGRTSNPLAPAAAAYPTHPITDRFGLLTVFPVARAMTPVTDNAARPAQSFVQTSARSWAETDLASLENLDTISPEPEKGDIAGPVSLAVAVTVPVEKTADAKPAAAAPAADEKKAETRVVAIGDSDFVVNQYLRVAPGNTDLFVNTVNWLSQQENLISIRPTDPKDRRVTVGANQMLVVKSMILIVPAAVIATGIITRRRRK